MNSPEKSLRERVSAEEWEMRVNLAACYRLVAGTAWSRRDLQFVYPRIWL